MRASLRSGVGPARAGVARAGPAIVAALAIALVGCSPAVSPPTPRPVEPLSTAASLLPSPTRATASASPDLRSPRPAPIEAALEATAAAQLQAVLDGATGGRAGGLTAAVVVPSVGIWTGAAGRADLDGTPMLPEHVHGIASVTKTFVAALLLDLQAEGRIDLDDRVDRWLPGVAVTNDATIRQLLNHRSGIADVGTSSEFIELLLTERDRDWTALEQLEYLGPPLLPAGAGFRYSNTNYLLAGLLIEAVTGRSAADALQEMLLAANGLDRVVLQGIGHPAPEPVAHGLIDVDEDGDLDDVNDDSGLIPFRSLATVAWTAGGIATDAPTLARWADAFYGGRILDASALSEMLDFRLYPYGLGVQRDVVADEVAWGHDGDIGAFRSSLRYLDRVGISIAVLTNDSTIDVASVMANLAAVATMLAP